MDFKNNNAVNSSSSIQKNKNIFSVKNIIVAAILILLCIIPSFEKNIYILHVISTIYMNVIVVMGLVVILGFSKQFTLGQAAFYGIGAYSTAILTRNFGMNFFLAIIVSGIIAGLFSLIIAIPGTKFKGPWLALVTLAFSEIVKILIVRLKFLTGGSEGFDKIPKPSIGNFIFDNGFKFYYLFFVLVILVLYVTYRVLKSPLGRIWKNVGDNENIASSIGINVFSQRIMAFVLGSIFAGVAGSVYAGYASYLSPHIISLNQTLFFLTILVIGGFESIPGVIIATATLTIFNNYLLSLYPWDMVIYGAIIILVVNLVPGGIGGLLSKIKFSRYVKYKEIKH